MKIAVYGQAYTKDSTEETAEVLFNYLNKLKHEIYVEQSFYKILKQSSINFPSLSQFHQLNKSFDLLITIGGDGTILRAVTYIANLGIPILGINTGRLGFLATVSTKNIADALTHFFSGKYKVSNRTLLAVETQPATSASDLNTYFALNEVAVSRKNTTSMITVETYLDHEYLTSYWADGLIIATPTGSTGYSLSCGGPVITPNANSFVITPIAPHNLSARPLIITDDTQITLKVNGRENQFLMSLDSRIITLPNTTSITIKKAKFFIKMVELQSDTFINTLRRKLLWGEDRRN